MSLLSLEKYLYDPRKRSEVVAERNQAGSYVEMSTRVLSAIRRSVLVGEAFVDLSEEMEGLRKSLHVESDASMASQNAARIETLLETFQNRVRQANVERASDFKNVLDILNETFTHLHAGSEKSDTRLKQFETDLNRAAKIDDISTLRGHLSKMLEVVRQEGKRDLDETHATLETLGQQIRQVHTATSRFRIQMLGRLEAIEDLKWEVADTKNSADLYLALFASDSLRALRARHGDDIAANMLEELGRKQIQVLAPEGKVFCWSPTSLLLMWHHSDTATAPGELPNRVKSPFEYRAFVGTRVATFNVAIRSLVMQGSGTADEIVWALDRFWKGGA